MLLALLMFVSCTTSEPVPEAPPEVTLESKAEAVVLQPIRIGWQTTWATQGQLAVILMKTDILRSNGFEPEFIGFSYGGPLNEGALAGEVDVLFTADQPAISLMSRAPDWQVLGRLMYNRVGTFVPPESPVQTAADLRGKTVAIPFGAAAHRETLSAIRDAGLDPDADVKAVNLGLQELVALIGAGSEDGRWGSIDAGSAWDPVYADLEHNETVRTIASGVVTSVVVMDQDFVTANPDADRRFMIAMREAYGWYRAHAPQANRWFKDESKLPFDLEVLDLAASVEPNLQVSKASEIRVSLNDEDLAGMQAAADFMLQAELLKAPVIVAPLIRTESTTDLPVPTPGKVKLLE
ncbi:MAG: sulfonate transport system substrate-binding protein [Myxococcota bacterium]|jgi:sulfonate transport system substrate-binding protein